MLHDIVLALSGIGGEVLADLLKDEIYALAVSIHPCEKALLNRLINIAESYKCLIDFIKKVPQFGEHRIKLDNETHIMPGMYLRAFCNGLYESLQPYRTCLIKLEEEILENADFTLTGVLAQVSPFTPLFTTLNAIINQIVVRNLHGCQILQLLHENLSTGIKVVDDAMARVMQSCHRVMIKQLTSWLLYGHLIDPYSEFFIEVCMSTPEVLSSSMATLDTESQTDTIMSEDNIPEYRIVEALVPSYIPPSIPEKAKFIGSTVMLFSRDPRDKKLSLDKKMHDSVFSKMETSLLDQLKSLQNCLVLDVSLLEAIVDNVRSCVTQHLFSLAKDKADLLGELRLIKEFYLLGRGELFVMFLRKACNALFKPVSTNSGRDLSNLLYTAARAVQLNSDVISEKFSFKVPPREVVAPKTSVWSVMSLEYTPPWPLHLLFTPSVLASYNVLFNFMLQVKIAELNLHDVWILNVKNKDCQLSPEVWTLRNCLMFLVHNLQCYLQLDVLESEYSVLLTGLDKTQDFEQVIHHHSVFLSHVTAQSFLLTKEVQVKDQPPVIKRHPVNKCLVDILKICDEFCSEVCKGEVSTESLRTMSGQLDEKIVMLMNLITLLGGKAEGLRLLLLRLDYNRYFSMKIS